MPISDPTTRVIKGDKIYCCPNCAAAMEQGGSDAASRAGIPICTQCGVAIVDRSTMQVRGGQPFCCPNCLDAMESFGDSPPSA
jgi:predicted RNA-binding Zn-ribbon protein involved in translation (DUF1610 family)